MKPGQKAKYEEYCNAINAFTKEFPKEVYIKFMPEDDKITIKAFLDAPKSEVKIPDFPESLKQGLGEVD